MLLNEFDEQKFMKRIGLMNETAKAHIVPVPWTHFPTLYSSVITSESNSMK